MMSIEKLFKEGLLKKITPSNERANKSIETAEKYLSEAKKSFGAEAHKMSIIGAYSSSFHAARAILFRDGIRERSHFAIYEYLREKHKSLGLEHVNSFNLYRKLGHSVAYGLDTTVEEDDAKEAIDFAEGFLKKVKDYLKPEADKKA